MTTHPTCQGQHNGKPCAQAATMFQPVRLCPAHLLQVARAALPQILDAAALQLEPAPPISDRLEVSSLLSVGGHEPIVYFIRHGDRIKIGTTRNLRGRIAALSLRNDDALLALRGGDAFEGSLHRHFAHLRSGDTEWFRAAADLLEFIARMSAKPSTPGTLQATVRRPDRRREVVLQIVKQAGPNGIGPHEVVAKFEASHPELEAPNRTVVGRWLSSDPRVSKPTYGRYAAV
ncbi:GIY-YIG nuclease family protein [Streptomyces anthocyanicus]|uniref:GIY-YIG nuclease family protein n=1 Tax=Streptomyces anthocyanicus TaxID=68174 RepID=UPI0036460C1F